MKDPIDQFIEYIRTGEHVDAAYEIFLKGKEGLVSQLSISDIAGVIYRFKKEEMDSESEEFFQIAKKVFNRKDLVNVNNILGLLVAASNSDLEESVDIY